MDGWSLPVLVRELLALYAHELQADHRHGGDVPRCRASPPTATIWPGSPGRTTTPRSRPGGRRWPGSRSRPTLAPRERTRVPAVPEQVALTLSEELTTALTRQARSQGLTLNTYVQAAWGLLLGRLTGRDDVVFGVTVAGRPPEIAGIESMVGLFINTLPLRLKLLPRKPFIELLRDLQDSQSRLIAHQHLGLAEIQGLAGLGDLFDTLTVFENYPVDEAALATETSGLRLTGIAGHDATHYPLSLLAAPGERLRLRLDYRADLFAREAVDAMAQRLVRLLTAAVTEPARPIGTSRHSLGRRAPHHPGRLERHRARRPGRHAARAVRRAGPAHARTPPRWSTRTRPSPTASSTRAPTSSRTTCARSAPAPRPSWGSASSAPSTWSSRSSASSRPAPPTCRSIPTIPQTASPTCCRMPAPPSSSRSPRCAQRLPRTHCPRRRPRRRPTDHRAPAHHRPTTPHRPAHHRLRHLHLRLHRTAKRRRRHACGPRQPYAVDAARLSDRSQRCRAGPHGDQLRCRRMGGLASPCDGRVALHRAHRCHPRSRQARRLYRTSCASRSRSSCLRCSNR